MRTLKSCLLATALVVFVIPAAANAAGSDPVATAATNVMHNLHEPVNAVNDLAQGKVVRAGGAVIRLLLNSTFGLGGLLDVASKSTDSCRDCVTYHENDAGKTLGFYGVPAGPKLAGTVTLRDLAGIAIDTSMGLAAFSGTSAPVARFLEPSAAAVGDAAGAGEH